MLFGGLGHLGFWGFRILQLRVKGPGIGFGFWGLLGLWATFFFGARFMYWCFLSV